MLCPTFLAQDGISTKHIYVLVSYAVRRITSLTSTAFILQFEPDALYGFSASFTYHFESKTMNIFVQSLLCYRDSFTNIIDFEGSWRANRTPFLSPSVIVRAQLEDRFDELEGMDRQIVKLERQLGVRGNHEAAFNVRATDFSVVIRHIHYSISHLAWSMHHGKMVERLLTFMDSVAVQYRRQAMANGFTEEEASEVEHALLDAHAYLRSLNIGVEDRTQNFTTRLQALSQIVSCVIKVWDDLPRS